MKRHWFIENGHTPFLAVVVIAGLLIPQDGAAAQNGINDARSQPVVEKRDPFWPIGYMPRQSVRSIPRASVKTAPVTGWNEAMKQVVINGVSSGIDNEHFAVINGDVKRVGDTVSVRLGTSVYTWAVDGIENPGSVKLRRLSVRQG